jgi:hypothetical protein
MDWGLSQVSVQTFTCFVIVISASTTGLEILIQHNVDSVVASYQHLNRLKGMMDQEHSAVFETFTRVKALMDARYC